jgi:uncharacterized phage protein gp47/JayE
MPFARPGITELRSSAVQDIETSGVPGLDGLLRNAVLRVLAWVMSGLAYGVYGYIDWIAREAVPFTATDEYLVGWAGLIGIWRKDATPASGTGAQFSGTSGTVLPTGSALTRQDGTPFTTTADGTIDVTGFVTVPILAEVNGAATNCDPGMTISMDAPITGINSGGMITGSITGGADQESDDELRTRMLFKYAMPPQGGSEADYIEWTTEVPGVTRAWILPQGQGPGSVTVYAMLDDVNTASNGFPVGTNGGATAETRITAATGDQLTIANHIYPLRPVTALVYVAAPVATAINVGLTALLPNDAATVAAITASLKDMFLAFGEVAGTIYPSQLYEAISQTPGVEHFTMTAPAAAVTAAAGHLPVLGTVTVS